jgi:hypothetical protein
MSKLHAFLVSWASRSSRITVGKTVSGSTQQEAGWAQEPVWTQNNM